MDHMLTPQIVDENHLCWLGWGDYLIAVADLLRLIDVRGDDGQHLVEVVTRTRCRIRGVDADLTESWGEQVFWVWRLGHAERPAWMPALRELLPGRMD